MAFENFENFFKQSFPVSLDRRNSRLLFNQQQKIQPLSLHSNLNWIIYTKRQNWNIFLKKNYSHTHQVHKVVACSKNETWIIWLDFNVFHHFSLKTWHVSLWRLNFYSCPTCKKTVCLLVDAYPSLYLLGLLWPDFLM